MAVPILLYCLHCYSTTNSTIRNNEVSDGAVGIYFNKHPNARAISAGVIENNYIHDVDITILTQANYLTVSNNIFVDGRLKLGGASGIGPDGDQGSDFNTFTHNTFGYTSGIEMMNGSDSGSPYPGALYNTFENNIYPVDCDSLPGFSISYHGFAVNDPHLSADYNLMRSSTVVRYLGTQYSSLTSFQTALGGCPNDDNECNSIEQNPTFRWWFFSIYNSRICALHQSHMVINRVPIVLTWVQT